MNDGGRRQRSPDFVAGVHGHIAWYRAPVSSRTAGACGRFLVVSAAIAVSCGACTLGPGLERRVSELFAQHRASLAVALDELGNELLFDIGRRAQDRMQAEIGRRGLTLSGELRAGDPGLALAAQGAVLRLAGAGRIGISLGESLLMRPLKSTSMVLGVGVDLPASAWSRCDQCNSRDKCDVRSRALAATATA